MTIRCYKHYQKPLAIGFDLDDTLYDNQPVLEQAESKLQNFLHRHWPKTQNFAPQDWLSFRNKAIAIDPRLAFDTSASRIAALRLGFSELGLNDSQSIQNANLAFDEFSKWRSNISVEKDVHQLLTDLSQEFRLFVITNGNADITKFGLDKYFEFALHAHCDMPMKPAQNMFELAQSRLTILPQNISYVGDHPVSDVVGANNAGWQSIWLNRHNIPLEHRRKPLQLPTLELSSLQDLSLLMT